MLHKNHKLSSSVVEVERRRFLRYNIRVQAELHPEGKDTSLQLETTDLSRNGCYVSIDAPLSVSTRVKTILLLGEEKVVVRGCVVTRHPEFGNGIMFLRFEDDGERLLRAYLDQLRSD